MRYQLPAEGLCTRTRLVKRNIHEYSHHVAAEIIPAARRRAQELKAAAAGVAVPEFLVATCVFLPRYFLSAVRQEWLRREALGQLAVGSLDSFRTAARSIARRLKPSEEDPELEKWRPTFSTVAGGVFPHFARLQEEGAAAIRICLFHRDLAEPNVGKLRDHEVYLAAFAEAHADSPEDVYFFFRWLTGGNRCYVAFPSEWPRIGLDDEPRDFAVFNGELLIEFHRDEKLYIQVEPGTSDSGVARWGSSWRFCDPALLLAAVGRAERGEIPMFSPDDFVGRVFFETSRVQDRVRRHLAEWRHYFVLNTTRDGGRLVADLVQSVEALSLQLPSIVDTPRLHALLDILGEPPRDFADSRGRLERARRIASDS